MGRYNNNVKVATFSKKVNINDIDPEFKFFDTVVTQREGNFVTVVSHEYYRPSYRTLFRRPGRKCNRPLQRKNSDEDMDREGTKLEAVASTSNAGNLVQIS